MKFRRVVISRHGGPEVLQVISDESGELPPGYVRVRVQAAGVAWADIMMRTGLYPGKIPAPPFTPGYDIAGVVEEVGDGNLTFKPGDQVAAITKIGGYSEVIDVNGEHLVPVPLGLDMAQVASLPLNSLVAYQMLHRAAKVKPGDKVLFHGAAGGVGTAFLQLGRLVPVDIYCTESQKKLDFVRSLGATAIDYRSGDFVQKMREYAPEGVDAAFDPIGGSHLVRSYQTLNSTGRLVAYGERAIVGEGVRNEKEAEIHEEFMSAHKGKSVGKSVQWYEVYDLVQKHTDWYQEDMRSLLNLLAESAISPIIAERIPFENATRAHELLEASAVLGKAVLIF